MFTKQVLADLETASSEYALRFGANYGKLFLEVQTRIVIEMMASLKRKSRLAILDVGGGHGQIARPLAELGHDMTVVGSAHQADLQVRDLVVSGACKWQTCSLLELPFEDRAFDVVTCIRLVSHCDTHPQLIAELCRVSANAVIIDYPPLASFNVFYPLLFGLKKKIEHNTRGYNYFRHHALGRIFRASGFSTAVRRGQFFFPMVMHRLLNNRSISKAIEWPFEMLGITQSWGSPTLAMYRRN